MKRITELQKEYGDAIRAVAPDAILVTHSVRDGANRVTSHRTHVCIPCPCKVTKVLQRKLHYLVNLYYAKVTRSWVLRFSVLNPRRHHPETGPAEADRKYRKIIFSHIP